MRNKFYIAVDCEGVACAVGYPLEGIKKDFHYEFIRQQATLEANAAATALFDMGAEEVLVWDNHSTGINLDYNLLDERCKIVLGSGHKKRFPKIDQTFAGVLFIGYHSHANTQDGVLSHTYSTVAYQSYQVNGIDVGEMQLDAAFAGEHQVPVIFASSDDKAIEQAKESFPWIKTVVTKQSLSWNSAISLHPKEACRQIYSEVKEAYSSLDQMKPYTFETPIQISLRYLRKDDAAVAPLFDCNGEPFIFKDPFTRKGIVKDIYHVKL